MPRSRDREFHRDERPLAERRHFEDAVQAAAKLSESTVPNSLTSAGWGSLPTRTSAQSGLSRTSIRRDAETLRSAPCSIHDRLRGDVMTSLADETHLLRGRSHAA